MQEARINFFTGKGGVGKSLMSLAAGLESARLGHRTLVVEFGDNHQVAQYTHDLDRLSYEPVRVFEDLPLYACRITVGDALEEYGVLKLKFKRAYRLVFENDMMRRMLDLLPGMDELLLLGKIWYLDQARDDAGAPVWDRVVVDTPSTGHGLSLLRLPSAILGTVKRGLFARETLPMLEMLRTPGRSLVHLVTLPEELPVRETFELAKQINIDLGISLGTCVINKVWKTQVDGPLRSWIQNQVEEQSAQGDGDGDDRDEGGNGLLQYLSRALSRQDRQARYIAELRAGLHGMTAFAEVPYLFEPTLGREQLEGIAPRIFSSAPL